MRHMTTCRFVVKDGVVFATAPLLPPMPPSRACRMSPTASMRSKMAQLTAFTGAELPAACPPIIPCSRRRPPGPASVQPGHRMGHPFQPSFANPYSPSRYAYFRNGDFICWARASSRKTTQPWPRISKGSTKDRRHRPHTNPLSISARPRCRFHPKIRAQNSRRHVPRAGRQPCDERRRPPIRLRPAGQFARRRQLPSLAAWPALGPPGPASLRLFCLAKCGRLGVVLNNSRRLSRLFAPSKPQTPPFLKYFL